MAGDHVDQPVPDLATPSSVDGGVSGGVSKQGGDAALDLGYTVTVDSFSGPLDLLLYLVRRTELDILEVPLSLIIDQFVETIRSWQDADLDVAGDFILMAATLLELKARTIVPPVQEDEATDDREPAFDPRQSLLRSLLAYRRFKEAAQCLDRLEDGRRLHLERQFREAIPEAPPEEGDFDLGELDLNLVMTTCERLMARIGGLGPRTVMVDEQPLGVRIAAMLDALAACQRATIRELLAGNGSRVVHITTLMASLELARQRLVEIEQPEQFGEIALRLRSTAEREREPELPPEEAPGPRRRRRLPLVTFSAANPPVNGDEDGDALAPEEPSESDETRFLRELEEATRVTAVLAITADVEKSFSAHWLTLHPELVPVVVPPPELPVAETPPTKTVSAEKSVPSQAPVSALAEVPAAVTEPTAEVAAVSPVGDESAPLVSENTLPPSTGDSLAADSVPADSASAKVATAADVVDAGASVTDLVISAQVEIITDRIVLSSSLTSAIAENPTVSSAASALAAVLSEISSSALVDDVAVNAGESPSLLVVAEAPATLALATDTWTEESPTPAISVAVEEPAAALVETPAAALVEESVAPAEAVHRAAPTVEPERVLDVEAWPVMRALPMPEETVDPLADLTSDDPAEVNALLHGLRSQVERKEQEEQEEEADDDDERDELDPDDLLGDDPAMVNAALQAAIARSPAPPRIFPELIIPPATETTIWTAPIDGGQTAASEPSDDSDDSKEQDVVAVRSLSEAVSEMVSEVASKVVSDDSTVVSASALVVEEIRAAAEKAQPSSALSASDEMASADKFAVADKVASANEVIPATEPMATAVNCVAPAEPSLPLVSTVTSEPTPTTALLLLAETSTEPAAEPAAERTDYSADDSAAEPVTEMTIKVSRNVPSVEEALTPAAIAESSLPLVFTVTSDPTPTTAALILAAAEDEPVTEVTIRVSQKILPIIASVELSEPSAALGLVSDGISTPSEVVASPLSEPPPSPPPPPPASPPRRSPSPHIALTSNPSPTRPMSTSPRSQAWLMIALIAAINLLWAGWTWFAWVPKDLVEIVASPQSMAILSAENNDQANAHESTLIWRFNVDVVDELGVSQAPTTAMPDVVPQLTPPLAGRWHWRDRRTLALETSEALPLATTFTAVFSAEKFRTTDGFRLRQSTTNSWSTAALALSAATVETFDRDGTTIALTFNQPVDPVAIAEALSVVLPPVEAQPVTLVTPPAPTATETPAVTATETATVATTQTATETPTLSTTETSVVAEVAKSDVSDPLPRDPATEPATEPKKAAVTTIPAATPPLVRALSSASASTVRLVIRSATRGVATISLQAGTVGIGGPLGLAQAWEQVVPLQQTLVLNQATARVPSHGAIRVEVMTSDANAPRDLLAPTITVTPAVPVSVEITATGLSVSGDFQPGHTYRIDSAAVWPDEPQTSGHVLSAYSAASSVNVVIPARPAGLWLLDQEVTAGEVRVAAHAVSTATATVLAQPTAEPLATSELTWTHMSEASTLLKIDDLVNDLTPAAYRLRVSATADATVLCEEKLVIEHVMVRPEALLRAVLTLAQAVAVGDQQSDVPVRVVRLTR